MKTKFELSVSISPEERAILQQAESILEQICFAFDEHDQCDRCPIYTICHEKLKGVSTLHSILYEIHTKVLDVEEE